MCQGIEATAADLQTWSKGKNSSPKVVERTAVPRWSKEQQSQGGQKNSSLKMVAIVKGRMKMVRAWRWRHGHKRIVEYLMGLEEQWARGHRNHWAAIISGLPQAGQNTFRPQQGNTDHVRWYCAEINGNVFRA